jgi:hypothetical protein
MPSIPLRRRAQSPELQSRCRSEVQRILATLDDAALTGNLARLGQAFSGDALSEIRGRFHAYQMAGIQVSPFREALQVEVAPERYSDGPHIRVRYRDRTSFLCSGAPPATANEPVQLSMVLDMSSDPWRVSMISEE